MTSLLVRGAAVFGSPWRRRWALSLSFRPATGSRCSHSGLHPPDLPRLAEAARISLTPQEAEEFAPKIERVVDWFGQLQAVDLKSIEPSLRAGTDTKVDDSAREDKAEVFDNREAILEAVPSYDEPFIKVPKVLNKE